MVKIYQASTSATVNCFHEMLTESHRPASLALRTIDGDAASSSAPTILTPSVPFGRGSPVLFNPITSDGYWVPLGPSIVAFISVGALFQLLILTAFHAFLCSAGGVVNEQPPHKLVLR
jgi:hypothetical protein